MKTINLLILIVLIVIPVSFGILYTFPNQIPHSTLEIHGMKDSYTVGEKYSFYYTLEGFGRSCHSVTVNYPNNEGKIIGWGVDRDCNTEIQNKEFFYDSREHEFHHDSLVPQIPGIYKVSVHIENIQPVIFEFRILDDFDATFGGPGNRHPAFLGYEIPDICTNDMIKHLVKHSNMFFADEENFSFEWAGLPEGVNADNFDVCYDELLELREESEPTPEPPPSPSKCKSGPAPSDKHYFNGDKCEWYLIQEPRVGDVFPYIWNSYLHKNSIDFSPQEKSYANTQPGFYDEKENRVCSSLIAGDGKEFYISSTFNVEPLEIIDTVITPTQPEDCQRIWKTDIILVEPTPELWGWLENYYDENEK